jgi:hypothetical protein
MQVRASRERRRVQRARVREKPGRAPTPSDGLTVDDAEMPENGDEQVPRQARVKTRIAARAGMRAFH